jgi:hypothetical protein
LQNGSRSDDLRAAWIVSELEKTTQKGMMPPVSNCRHSEVAQMPPPVCM